MLSQTCSEFPDRTPQVTAIFSAAALAGLALGSFGVGPLRAHLGLHRIYALSALGPLMLLLLLVALRRGAREVR
jgi:predicted MFS family arabinose efflux permease